MSIRKTRTSKRWMVVAAAATLCASTVAITGSVSADSAATVERAAGANRYQTAVEVVIHAEGDDVASEVDYCSYQIVSGVDFPDGLTASVYDDYILLTEQAALQADTKAFLDTLVGTPADPGECSNGTGATFEPDLDITIVGGPAVVSSAQLEVLQTYGSAKRVYGADRYATALAVAADSGSFSHVYLTTGMNFPDALAGGALASSFSKDPILLNDGDTLRADVLKVISSSGITHVTILGGTSAVPASIETFLKAAYGKTVTRLGGADRAETAVKIAAELKDAPEGVTLVNGWGFADALGAAIWAGDYYYPILLTQADSLPAATKSYLEKNCATVDYINVAGGTAAVSKAVVDAAVAASRCDNSEATITSAVVTNSGFVQAQAEIQNDTTFAALTAKAKAGSPADGSPANAWEIQFTENANKALGVVVWTACTTAEDTAGTCEIDDLPYIEVTAPNFTGLTFASLQTAWAASGADALVNLVWDTTDADLKLVGLPSDVMMGSLVKGEQDTTIVVTFSKALTVRPGTLGVWQNFSTPTPGPGAPLLAATSAVATPAVTAAGVTSATYKWDNQQYPVVPGSSAYHNIRFNTGVIIPVSGGANAAPVVQVLSGS